MKNISAVVGWYGVIAILLGYALSSFSVISNQDIWYHILNGTGALGIVIDTYADRFTYLFIKSNNLSLIN